MGVTYIIGKFARINFFGTREKVKRQGIRAYKELPLLVPKDVGQNNKYFKILDERNYENSSIADGRTISIETGKVAKQADGAAVLRMGNTVLLATVCAAKEAVPGTDFMPLQVDYREQYAAAGRYPGGSPSAKAKPMTTKS